MDATGGLRGQLRRAQDRLHRPGLAARGRRRFDIASAALVALFAAGWLLAITASVAEGDAPRVSPRLAKNPLSPLAPAETAFLLDAAVRRLSEPDFRGLSQAVRIVVREPGDTLILLRSDTNGVTLQYEPAEGPGLGPPVEELPPGPGLWNLLVRIRGTVAQVPDLVVITTVPTEEIRGGLLGRYRIGEWPGRGDRRGSFLSPAYDPPRGLIMVTPENQDLRVSEHFRLRDFLTKGQEGVWPKYVALSPRLLDKLELTIQELNASGYPVRNVGVVSGFRTPNYNRHGGDPRGRGAFSRHMYGDAADFFIDNDGDGRMDDLTGDGRVTVEDARVIAAAAERVEQRFPELIGGIGIYPPQPGIHSGFVHIDTRGYRARW